MFNERTQDVLSEAMTPEESPVRELTIDEAIGMAILLQKQEQFDAAHMVYSRILEEVPDHPDALHFSGVLAEQMGKPEEAIAFMQRSVALVPDSADWQSNLGIALQSVGRFDEALVAFERAIALDPSHVNAHSNHGVMLRATGRPAEAEAAYRAAIALNPKHIDAWTNLGILLNGLKRTKEAVDCFCQVILLRPKHPEARRLLGLAHTTLGQIDEAVAIFKEWLEEDPNSAIARHMLAACTGRDVPARASDGFVKDTFDSFAASFESKLAQLSYRAPKLVALMLEDSNIPPAKDRDILDAGCGTGLCGPLLAPWARTIVGVDLSKGMLDRAREKHVYDELVEGELTAYLREHPATWDVIVSADTLVYFGALDGVIGAASAALRPGGLLIFTVERAETESDDYRLELHGRYCHARGYVERVLQEAGLTPEIAESDLRMESGAPVAGLVIRATKAGVVGASAGGGHDA